MNFKNAADGENILTDKGGKRMIKVRNIDNKRLMETFEISSSIGRTENNGLNRLALSPEDQQMRDIFVKWLKEENLEVRVDDFGNIYGKREGKIKDAPSVAIGSHLDTQPCGGRFDGIFGVLASLEVIRRLNDYGIETDYPIEIINFTNEEGARFEPPMLGSGGVSNTFSKEFIYSSKDENGISFKQALQSIGYMGEEKNRIKNIKNFVELHIEQGPILDKEDKSIGIIGGIIGMSWVHVKVIGETNHAGPTPMSARKDALVPASEMILRINEITKQYKGLKTTVGKVSNKPNAVNVIPGEVDFTFDIRHKDDVERKRAIEQLTKNFNEIANKYNVEIEITTEWNSDAVHFSTEVIDSITEATERLNYSSMSFYSGPGHDAKYMNSLCNSGMIFVKSIGGISHNENELTADEDLIRGANVLLHVVQKLANK